MLRAMIALPFLLLLILFALSNWQPVTLTLWPTDFLVTTRVSTAILLGMGGAFLLGALIVWIPALVLRRHARRFERDALRLKAQLDDLKRNAPVPGTAVAAR